MHIEILTEDSSTACLLKHMIPKLVGPMQEPHSWRIHPYSGIGRIPPNLGRATDTCTRMLLNKLPAILRAHVKTQGIDAVLVVLDTDTRPCASVLSELRALSAECGTEHLVMFRLAIEETEAWYLGDREALMTAYPNAKVGVLAKYAQDSVCGTWDLLADALHPGGAADAKKGGGARQGQLKHQWAANIGPHMNPDANQSPSFAKLRDGLRRLAASAQAGGQA
jgi:hypothetical protein